MLNILITRMKTKSKHFVRSRYKVF